MIDLRSDTLTMPGREMLETILSAPLGDSGRTDSEARGCDPTVSRLEDMAAQLTGKERAIFLPSGTMGNLTALLTHCGPNDEVLIDTRQHLYRTEKAAFEPKFGQLKPVFYHLTPGGWPDTDEIETLLKTHPIKLLCVENTHNGAGGTVIPPEALEKIGELGRKYSVPVHMDGARLFNAAAASGLSAAEICRCADSVMFCISKGLGAPVGSMLCGSREFIIRANATRKLLGGSMRQAGVLAACGIYALEHQIPDLAEDHRRAKLCLDLLQGMKKLQVPERICSNIIIIGTEATGKTPAQVVDDLKKQGVWLSLSGDTCVRIVLCRDRTDEEVRKAAEIIRSYDAAL
ncbi:MAG: low specificity L-threonine aldolase [Pyramidobacter sp.]|nr:low specificity L-threonine aldolase [Pyramidobacter sp.]